MTALQPQAHLRCYQQHVHWNLRNVAFSNDSRVCLRQLDHKVRVWRRCGLVCVTFYLSKSASLTEPPPAILISIHLYILFYLFNAGLWAHGLELHVTFTCKMSYRNALILHGMNSTTYWEHSSKIMVHVDMIASYSSSYSCCRFFGCTSMMWICSTRSQRCSLRDLVTVEIRSHQKMGTHLS